MKKGVWIPQGLCVLPWLDLWVPETWAELATGLLETESLDDQTGMLFFRPPWDDWQYTIDVERFRASPQYTGRISSPSLHTYGMKYPIDLLHLTLEGMLYKYTPRVPPSSVCPQTSAYVIEVAGGWVRRNEGMSRENPPYDKPGLYL